MKLILWIVVYNNNSMKLRVYVHFLIFDMIKFQVVIWRYMEPSRLLSALSSRANDSTILCLIVYIPKPCYCIVELEWTA